MSSRVNANIVCFFLWSQTAADGGICACGLLRWRKLQWLIISQPSHLQEIQIICDQTASNITHRSRPTGNDLQADRWLRSFHGIKRVINETSFSARRWASRMPLTRLQIWRGLRLLRCGTCGSHDRQQRQKDGRVASARGGARSNFHTINGWEPDLISRSLRAWNKVRGARIKPVHEGRRRRCGLKRGHLIADAVWDA